MRTIKPCTVSIRVQSEMKVLGTFDGNWVSGRDTTASLILKQLQ